MSELGQLLLQLSGVVFLFLLLLDDLVKKAFKVLVIRLLLEIKVSAILNEGFHLLGAIGTEN